MSTTYTAQEQRAGFAVDSREPARRGTSTPLCHQKGGGASPSPIVTQAAQPPEVRRALARVSAVVQRALERACAPDDSTAPQAGGAAHTRGGVAYVPRTALSK